MSTPAAAYEDTGLEVIDLGDGFASPPRRTHAHDFAQQMEAMQRIARTYVENPEGILQQLVDAAVELCEADSAGISVEIEGGTDANFYHWLATAGQYSSFLHAILPRYPSACGITLERCRPQRFRVSQPFFDRLGISAPLVTDGILLPWEVDGLRGTIFIMAHGRSDAFDQDDRRLMEVFANFAALGVRQRNQQKLLLEQARVAAAAAMANELAHQINNPLQSLTNILYLAAKGHYGEGARALGVEVSPDLDRLSLLVEKLLSLPESARVSASQPGQQT